MISIHSIFLATLSHPTPIQVQASHATFDTYFRARICVFGKYPRNMRKKKNNKNHQIWRNKRECKCERECEREREREKDAGTGDKWMT